MNLRFDPTHHVADRGLAESPVGDPSIRVDNAVAAVAFDHGDEVRVRASPEGLRGNDPVAAEAFAELDVVALDEDSSDERSGDERLEAESPGGERPTDERAGDDRRDDEVRDRRSGAGSERRARLPEDRERIEALLDFDGRFADDENAWVARLFDVDEFTVLAGETPIYRSIPHETHVRDLNDAVPGFIDAAAAAVAEFPGVAVLPVDPLARWTVDGTEYALNAETVRFPGSGEDRWRWFDLSKLEYARAVPERGELALQWRDPRGTSLVARARTSVTRLFTGAPPTRLPAPGEALRDVTRTLLRLRDDLGYDFVVDDAGLAGDEGTGDGGGDRDRDANGGDATDEDDSRSDA